MRRKQVARSRPSFGKGVFTLFMALQTSDPLMYAYASDSLIDYSRFNSAEEARAAALHRVEQTIQASMTPISAEPAMSDATSASEQHTTVAESQIETPPALAAATPGQPDGTLRPTQERKELKVHDRPIMPGPLESRVVALGDASLDQIRGGFEAPESNLRYSFGIDRVVFINGVLTARTVINLQDLATASGRGVPLQASVATNATPSAMGVIQNGPDNHFTAQIGPDMVGTVIQNTLDNQKIQSVTTVNASINSMQVMRAMSVQSAVQSGIVDSLRR